MKVSIFTPTHNPAYLNDLYESIIYQDFYEWVIVLNGDFLKYNADVSDTDIFHVLFPEKAEDSRVKFRRFGGPSYVGALKNYACFQCTGDILLEVDHDDILTSDAIDEVISAFESNPEVGFVYSNFSNFKEKYEKTDRYTSGNGWEYKPFNYYEFELEETLAFNDHPTAVSRIWFAPNHLRAWRTTIYHKIGGHNKNMRVLDDQELICRTYIETKFHHIDKCLYLYRIDNNNTWLKYNKEIQDNVMPLHCQFIQDMSVVWANRNNKLALDLGGRFHKKPGVVSVDLKDSDVVADLNEVWPFEDNSVGCIIANDFIEHLRNPLHLMKEAHRVLCDGGIFLISVPSTDGRGAFQDPTHVSFWNENSFWYYTRVEQATFIDTPVRFQNVHLKTYFPTEWHRNNNISYVVAHLVALKNTGIKLSGPIGI